MEQRSWWSRLHVIILGILIAFLASDQAKGILSFIPLVGPKLSPLEISFVLLAPVVLASAIINKHKLLFNPPALALCAFALVAVISALLSIQPRRSMLDGLLIGYLALLYLLFFNLMSNEEGLRWGVQFFILFSAITALVGFTGFLIFKLWGIKTFAIFFTEGRRTIGEGTHLVNFLGMVKETSVLRIKSFFYHPYGLVPYLGMACALGMTSQFLPVGRWAKRLGILAVILSMLIVSIGMYRGAFLVWGALFLGLGLWPASRLRTAGRVLTAAVTMALLIMAILQTNWSIFPVDLTWDGNHQKLVLSVSLDHYGYFYLHRAGWLMFLDYPLLGAGPRMFNVLMTEPQYLIANNRYPLLTGMDPHSTYLGYLAETGMVGLGCFLLFFALTWWAAYKLGKANSPWAPLGKVMAPFLILILIQAYCFDIVTLRYMYLLYALIFAAGRMACPVRMPT